MNALNFDLDATLMHLHEGKYYSVAYSSKKTDICQADVFHFGKGVLSHCVGHFHILVILGWQTICFGNALPTNPLLS